MAVLYIRCTDEQLADLDAIVEARQERAGTSRSVSRSEVVRELIARAKRELDKR